MIPVPYGLSYTADVAGSEFKHVHCAQCGKDYVYVLSRVASGHGKSLLFLGQLAAQARAVGRAKYELRRMLKRGVDAVPCPSCGWYQDDMVPVLRRQYRRTMLMRGVYLFITSVLLLVPTLAISSQYRALFPWLPLALLAAMLVALALIIAKMISSSKYDPNRTDSDLRKELGRRRAMLREDYQQWILSIPSDDELVTNQEAQGEDQLVGQGCRICGRRIGSILDGHYCLLCRSPIHNRCAKSMPDAAGPMCKRCGAIARAEEPRTT